MNLDVDVFEVSSVALAREELAFVKHSIPVN